EILGPIAQQDRTIELGIAADIGVVAGVEGRAGNVAPGLVRLEMRALEDRSGVAGLGTVRQTLASFQDQDAAAGGGQSCRKRRAPHARADDKDVRLHQTIRSSVFGSKATAFSMFTAKSKACPEATLASARIR